MFSKYFQSELSFLHEMGREFSLKHPALADMLAERGSDPDVERLLEGFAFLTARIREKAEDSFPELIEPLAETLFPQWIRPIAACSIVEFSPKPGALRNRFRIPQGTPLATTPIEGTSCQFRTTSAVDLLPVTISNCTLRAIGGSQTEIEIRLDIPDHGVQAISETDALRLFIHGTNTFSSELCFWFREYLHSIHWMSSENQPQFSKSLSVQLPMLDFSAELSPCPENANPFTRLLQENFNFIKKFFFIEIKGLQTLPWDQISNTLKLIFRFNHPADLADPIRKDTFRLNCTPVVNLFEVPADPVLHSPIFNEYLLRPNGLDPNHAEVFQVTSVIGMQHENKTRTSYASFSDYAHISSTKSDSSLSTHLSSESSPFYFTRRKKSPLDQAHDTYLSISSPSTLPLSSSKLDARFSSVSQPPFSQENLPEETLSIELLCTNRLLPMQLRPGDICVPLPQSPTVASFQNITEVSKPIHPALGSELQWRYLSHLKLSKSQLSNLNHLQSICALYNLQQNIDIPLGRVNQQKISGMRSISVEPSYHMVSMKTFRGTRTTIEIDESSYASTGEIFFWGEVLQSFFSNQVRINSLHELTFQLQPSNRTLYWPPKIGSLSLI